MESEYTIKTTNYKRKEVQEKIHALGYVTDEWKDGSFDFKCYDEQCVDEMSEILDDLDIEYNLN